MGFDLLLQSQFFIFQQPGEDQRGSGSVIGAGHDTGRDHRLLHVVELSALEQTFSGADLSALSLVEQDQIGIFQLVVENNGIRAGEAFGIVAVTDGEVACAVQDISQTLGGFAQQANLFAKTLQFGWSVRQLEEAAKKSPEKKEKPRPAPLPPEYEELSERLRHATGLKVTMEGTQQKGKIVLSYSGEEELQRLWDLLEQ